MVFLARNGIPQWNEQAQEELERDIAWLLSGEEGDIEDGSGWWFSYLGQNKSTLVPAIHSYTNLGIPTLLCKGWLSKNWNRTKKFVKKHKKAIIVATVVVAVATVIIVATSGAAAPAAAGAAAAASSASQRPHINKPGDVRFQEDCEPPINPSNPPVASFSPPPNINLPSTSIEDKNLTLTQIIHDQTEALRETLSEEPVSQDNPTSWATYIEVARETGAYLAHQAYAEIAELISFIPQLCEGITEIGTQFLSENLPVLLDDSPGSPTEKYEHLVALGHGAIDNVLNTDQAPLFTSENRPMKDVVMGIIPLPGEIPKVFSNTNRLIEAGNAIDRAGFTKAGRGLMKHGNREGSIFPKPTGTPVQVNAFGKEILESILSHPERQTIYGYSKNLGEVIDIYAPEIGGVRYNTAGEFIGFLEP